MKMEQYIRAIAGTFVLFVFGFGVFVQSLLVPLSRHLSVSIYYSPHLQNGV